MIFPNTEPSLFFEVDDEHQGDCDLGRCSIQQMDLDDNDEIRYVSAFMKEGYLLGGLRFFGQNDKIVGKIIDSDHWDAQTDHGFVWTDKQEIPEGQRIVGLKATTEYMHFTNLSFLLGTIDGTETGELRFPQMEMYPDFADFQTLYGNGDFQLLFVNYKTYDDQYLSGLQFGFSRATSPMFETEDVKDKDSTILQLNMRQVRFISFDVDNGLFFTGMKMLDENKDRIFKKVWYDEELHGESGAESTDKISIPDGKQIIGMRVNTNDSQFITYLSIITGPII